MKRNFVASLAMAGALTLPFSSAHAFDLFGLFKKNGIDDMLDYVPADTALFVGGVADPKLLNMDADWYADTDMSAMASQLVDTLAMLNMPSDGVLAWLIEDYLVNSAEGSLGAYKAYGFDTKGASTLYMDGMFPVLRIAVDKPEKFHDAVAEAAAATNSALTRAENGIVTVPMLSADQPDFSLAYRIEDGMLTISAVIDSDTDASKAQRLGLTKPAQALGTEAWDTLGEDYDLDKNARGFLNLVGIVDGVLNENSALRQQVLQISGNNMPLGLLEQCGPDVRRLVSGMPRFVFGSNEIAVEGSEIDMTFTLATEIANSSVLTELTKLRGFVPDYVTGEEAIVGVGLGLNVNELTPVLTTLWTQFTQAEFDCAPLQQAQQSAMQANPAFTAMFTGMLSGTKGLGFAAYGLQLVDQNDPESLFVDALVSMSAEQPEAIAGLVSSFVPMLQGQAIPADGTPVKVQGLPFQADIYIAQKGKHLVVYSGEESKKQADLLTEVELDINGLSAMKLDYKKAGDAITQVPLMESVAEFGTGNCAEMVTLVSTLQSIDMQLVSKDDFTAEGLATKIRFSGDMSDSMAAWNSMAGEYHLEYLDEDVCEWTPVGTEILNEDGTGLYQIHSDDNACVLLETSYNWQGGVLALEQVYSSEKERESCDSEWEENELFDNGGEADFVCDVVTRTKNELLCTDQDTESTYRYTRK